MFTEQNILTYWRSHIFLDIPERSPASILPSSYTLHRKQRDNFPPKILTAARSHKSTSAGNKKKHLSLTSLPNHTLYIYILYIHYFCELYSLHKENMYLHILKYMVICYSSSPLEKKKPRSLCVYNIWSVQRFVIIFIEFYIWKPFFSWIWVIHLRTSKYYFINTEIWIN